MWNKLLGILGLRRRTKMGWRGRKLGKRGAQAHWGWKKGVRKLRSYLRHTFGR